MKRLKYYFLLLLVMASLSFLFLPFPNAFADASKNVIQLTTSPAHSFINMQNMAPGDTVSEVLIVKNSGNIDFNYFVSAKMEKGEQMLFDQLRLKITKENKTLFSGKLNDLQKFEVGKLESNKRNDLTFTIELPIELGNEFQNKSTTLSIIFTAEGIPASGTAGNGTNLPVTGTNTFNILAVGVLLVLLGLSYQIPMNKRRKITNQM